MRECVLNIRVSDSERRQLATLAALESIRLGRRVTTADLVRRGLAVVTGTASEGLGPSSAPTPK